MTDYIKFITKFGITKLSHDMDVHSEYTGTPHNQNITYAGRSTVTMTLPIKSFDRIININELMDIEAQEALVRDEVPAVTAAYDHYRTLLKLVK